MPPKSKRELEKLKAEKDAKDKEARREKRRLQKEYEESLITEYTVRHYPCECRDTIEEELSYSGINEYEYLNLNGSRKRFVPLGLEEVNRYLNTVIDDKVVKHFDLGNNIGLDDVNVPSKMREFWKALKEMFTFNKAIIAMHLEGNHLFDNSEHPSNEHLTNYVMDFVNAIAGSNILHLDISENSITGEQGRMLKGLNQLMKRWATTALSFKCRMSRLHSQGFCTVSVGLGIKSSIMYLDLSDNFGGLDPNGRKNSEGIQVFCRQLAGTLNLRILKLARNFFGDEDICLISQAVSYLKNLQILDLSGNICHVIGAEAIAEALLCHVNLTGLEGLKEIDLSCNPLRKLGLLALCRAIDRSDTLIILKVARCDIERDEMVLFRDSLAHNVLIEYLDVSENPASDVQEDMAQAEVEANRLIITLKKNPFAVDANQLSLAVSFI
jgi:Ran GTPase-activating protein (RanGAP) involved in mRNA processing and transport